MGASLGGVIGTAGHVDHGKSSLVRALTGQEPDRLPQELARGMSIELGFVAWPQPAGPPVAMVDVPGHQDFIKTMVVGAGGIDLALLVIAADDGLMPQSLEHAHILQLLGVQRAVVALTKVDLAGPELTALAQEELEAWLSAGPWAGAPVLPCAAPQGLGLPALEAALRAELALALGSKPQGPWPPLRLPIDRAFLAKGRGVVVAGPLRQGELAVGQGLRAEPAGLAVRVRALQSLGQDLERAQGPGRLALALAGVEGQEGVQALKGGWLVEEGAPPPTQALVVALRLAPGVEAWPKRGGLRLHAGATHLLARWRPLPGLLGGATLAWLGLDGPVVASPGDRLLVRRPSPDALLGVAEVLHAAPPPWRLAKAWASAWAQAAQDGPLAGALAALNLTPSRGLEPGWWQGFWPQRAHAEEAARGPALRWVAGRGHPAAWAKAQERGLRQSLEAALAAKPWVDGLPLGAWQLPEGWSPGRAQPWLRALLDQGRLALSQGRWSLPGHAATVAGPLAEAEARALALLAQEGGLSEAELMRVAPEGLAGPWRERLGQWRLEGLACQMSGLWLDPSWVRQAEEALREAFPEGGFTTSEARQALGSTRKLCIPLLEWLDEAKHTQREGDRRRWRGGPPAGPSRVVP